MKKWDVLDIGQKADLDLPDEESALSRAAL
jgi:hypothetical protein